MKIENRRLGFLFRHTGKPAWTAETRGAGPGGARSAPRPFLTSILYLTSTFSSGSEIGRVLTVRTVCADVLAAVEHYVV